MIVLDVCNDRLDTGIEDWQMRWIRRKLIQTETLRKKWKTHMEEGGKKGM